MRAVIALGGNALLRRGQPMTAANQRANIRLAAAALGEVASRHQLVIAHGNGPQVGLLALQGMAYDPQNLYPLDVLGAESEGMIGYLIEQELGNVVPEEQSIVTVLTQVEVDPHDPAFQHPTKPIGPVYDRAEAERLAAERDWTIAPEDGKWRRVVASPEPMRIFELRPIRVLLDNGVIVICTGGGGIPTAFHEREILTGIEAVIDKDLASSLLATSLDADRFVMLTDVDAVVERWGTPEARRIRCAHPDALDAIPFASGSMGPKVKAAGRFARATGRPAMIGSLAQTSALFDGDAGTTVTLAVSGLEYWT